MIMIQIFGDSYYRSAYLTLANEFLVFLKLKLLFSFSEFNTCYYIEQ